MLQGDEAAWTTFYEKTNQMVYLFAYSRAKDHYLAEEIVAQHYSRLPGALKSFKADQPFWPWYFKVVGNLVTDVAYRAEKPYRENTVSLEGDGDGGLAPAEQWGGAIRGNVDHPDQHSVIRETAAEMKRLIDRISSPQHRLALIYVGILGFSLDETSQRLGVSVAACKTNKHRGLNQFRELMKSSQEIQALSETPEDADVLVSAFRELALHYLEQTRRDPFLGMPVTSSTPTNRAVWAVPLQERPVLPGNPSPELRKILGLMPPASAKTWVSAFLAVLPDMQPPFEDVEHGQVESAKAFIATCLEHAPDISEVRDLETGYQKSVLAAYPFLQDAPPSHQARLPFPPPTATHQPDTGFIPFAKWLDEWCLHPLQAGSLIPNPRLLAQNFGVSSSFAKLALEFLTAAGRIEPNPDFKIQNHAVEKFRYYYRKSLPSLMSPERKLTTEGKTTALLKQYIIDHFDETDWLRKKAYLPSYRDLGVALKLKNQTSHHDVMIACHLLEMEGVLRKEKTSTRALQWVISAMPTLRPEEQRHILREYPPNPLGKRPWGALRDTGERIFYQTAEQLENKVAAYLQYKGIYQPSDFPVEFPIHLMQRIREELHINAYTLKKAVAILAEKGLMKPLNNQRCLILTAPDRPATPEDCRWAAAHALPTHAYVQLAQRLKQEIILYLDQLPSANFPVVLPPGFITRVVAELDLTQKVRKQALNLLYQQGVLQITPNKKDFLVLMRPE